ncbi:leucine zipper protein 2 [Thalassophryne amazonica]|uniref:leucine zipper protein 2 n=1 Tax=Thalassophryne amazonica TaxID=390379 RepID=UPI0014713D49|nr:leucine zipper protein 2 [Thalassophryne amazonica]
MRFIRAVCLLLLCPALSLNTRQSYDGLEKKLKEVFSERSSILHQLSKTSKELDSIKGNLQLLKNDDSVAKKDVQRILELSHKQREEMKSLQAALQKQLDEANERAEKQQAMIKFLKVEMEKKTKIIKDLQQENKSLKNKLLSGNKLCDAYAEESKKIQAQLKELRYGKKDLIFKGQQLMDLEHKLTIAKEELEKTALDKESQLKALKDTVHICFSAVLHNQPSSSHRFPTSPTHLFRYSSLINSSRVTFQQPHIKDIAKVQRIVTSPKSAVNTGVMRRKSDGVKECQMEKTGGDCYQNQTEESASGSKKLVELHQQQSQAQSGKLDTKLADDSDKAKGGGSSKKTKLHTYN